MLVDLDLPPGVITNGTPRKSKGAWRDAQFVRWVEGVAQPIGKWRRISPSPLPGRVCGIHPVRDNAYRRWLVVGTNEGVFTLESGGWVDRTPEGFSEGYPDTRLGAGYGAANYGEEDYSTPREQDTGLSLEADNWTFDTWGEITVGCSQWDGTAFLWSPGDVNTAPDETFTAVPNAPVDNRALLVTNERHLMLIAAGGDPRKIQWSAREDYTEWSPTALNLAGDLTLETAGTLQTGLKVAGEILVLSDVDAFRVNYVGQPFGYGQERVGINCGILGPKAGTGSDDFAVWMGENGFWYYRGQLQPLPCGAWDFVFRDLNYTQRAQITCDRNAEFNEVWWFFPKEDADRNTHYVVWNYAEDWWTVGKLPRTTWRTRGMWTAQLASGADGHIYEHEQRLDALGVRPRARPYLQSSPFELGSGDRLVPVVQIVPDQDCRSLNALRYTFETRFTPTCPSQVFGPFYPNATGYTDVRFVGREVTWRVEAEEDIDWRIGVLRADIRTGGRR